MKWSKMMVYNEKYDLMYNGAPLPLKSTISQTIFHTAKAQSKTFSLIYTGDNLLTWDICLKTESGGNEEDTDEENCCHHAPDLEIIRKIIQKSSGQL